MSCEGCTGKCNHKPTVVGTCGRCYDEGVELFPATCSEQPELLVGAPLGMYHCPDCGAMLMAGLPHPPMCQRCTTKTHPGFDVI